MNPGLNEVPRVSPRGLRARCGYTIATLQVHAEDSHHDLPLGLSRNRD